MPLPHRHAALLLAALVVAGGGAAWAVAATRGTDLIEEACSRALPGEPLEVRRLLPTSRVAFEVVGETARNIVIRTCDAWTASVVEDDVDRVRITYVVAGDERAELRANPTATTMGVSPGFELRIRGDDPERASVHVTIVVPRGVAARVEGYER